MYEGNRHHTHTKSGKSTHNRLRKDICNAYERISSIYQKKTPKLHINRTFLKQVNNPNEKFEKRVNSRVTEWES